MGHLEDASKQIPSDIGTEDLFSATLHARNLAPPVPLSPCSFVYSTRALKSLNTSS